jgi:hypothetical protein
MAPPPENPYAPPLHEPGALGASGRARVLGPILIVGNGYQFPPLCVKCGTTDALEARRQLFVYAPAWARLFGAFMIVMVQKKSRFVLPICAPCQTAWRRWNALAVLSLFAPLGLLAASGSVLSSRTVPGGAVTSFLLAIPFGILAWAGVLRGRTERVVTATRIDREETWLRGVHEAARKAG